MRFIREAELQAYSHWDRLSPQLQATRTKVLYLAPDKDRYDLMGEPGQVGRQGVHLATQLQGEHHWPFELLLSEGAYQQGATVERVNVLKRDINFGIQVGGEGFSDYQYRMAEDRWWATQDENRDGWLGVYTRYSGWRWIPVRPAKTVDTAQPMDPVAFGNNFAKYDINWLAQRPYYAKPSLYDTWSNSQAVLQLGPTAFGEGNITLVNRGDLAAWPKFLVSSPGQATLQDGVTDRMVPLPLTVAADGYLLIDTDPTQRTITASRDPVDNLFYKIIRQSKILDFFLHDLAATGLPVWRRFDKRFMSSIPGAREMNGKAVTFKVRHTDPNGTITAIMPQPYKRSR